MPKRKWDEFNREQRKDAVIKWFVDNRLGLVNMLAADVRRMAVERLRNMSHIPNSLFQKACFAANLYPERDGHRCRLRERKDDDPIYLNKKKFYVCKQLKSSVSFAATSSTPPQIAPASSSSSSSSSRPFLPTLAKQCESTSDFVPSRYPLAPPSSSAANSSTSSAATSSTSPSTALPIQSMQIPSASPPRIPSASPPIPLFVKSDEEEEEEDEAAEEEVDDAAEEKKEVAPKAARSEMDEEGVDDMDYLHWGEKSDEKTEEKTPGIPSGAKRRRSCQCADLSLELSDMRERLFQTARRNAMQVTS